MTQKNQKPETEDLSQDILEDNQNSQKSSKEMWLFLIIIDIIALGVFGFFIYKAFFTPSAVKPAEEFMQEVLVEDIQPAQPLPSAEAVKPASEPKKAEAEVKKEEAKPAKEDDKKAQEPSASPAKKEVKQKETSKKQSVFISGSGKWRKVTFKYYGIGGKVAIVGGFTMRKHVPLKKKDGVWSATLTIGEGEYRYMYVVDGREVPDPNAKQEDGKSVLIVK